MKPLQAIKDPYVATGALGALLALSLLLVHLPATIYGGNLGELAFGLADYLLVAAMVLVPAMVAIVLVLAALQRAPRMVLAGLLCGIGLVTWLYGNFSLGDTIVMDGRHKDSRFDTWLGGWELAIVSAGMLAVGVLAARYARSMVLFLAVLNVGLATGTAWELVRDPRHFSDTLRVEDGNALFRFSTRGNVLLVLMDSLQSDVFERIARANADIRDAFDGFTLYRDTLGVAPTTLLSLPAIHSGEAYVAGESIDAYYDRAIAKGSFLNRLAESGYEATLVNPMRGVCPLRATCFELVLLVGSRSEELTKSALRLLDFSLLRVVPFALKAHVYNGQRWLLSSKWQYSIFVDNVVQGNAVMEKMASQATLDAGPPTVKFVHLMNTHAPFILQGDCLTFTSDLANPVPDAQVRCALRSFVSLLDRLKKEGLYDSATIALVADHGYALPSEYQRATDNWGPWSVLMGAANPVFLLKRPGARGTLAHSDESNTLADAAGLVCSDLSAGCSTRRAPSSTPTAVVTPREFLWYRWEDIGWGRSELPRTEIGRYVVTGPLWERSSWRLADPLARRYRPSNSLGFMPADEEPELSPFEWSIAQTPGTWTEGHTATVALDLGSKPDSDLELVADAYAFLPPQRPSQRVAVLANGVEVGQWRFDASDPEGLRRARIPQTLFTSGILRVTFLLPDAVSPAALGLSTDPRLLSLGLRRLDVSPSKAVGRAAASESVAGARPEADVTGGAAQLTPPNERRAPDGRR